MSSIHVRTGGNLKTGNLAIGTAGATNWSVAFDVRINVAPAAQVNNVFGMIAGATFMHVRPTDMYLGLQCGPALLFLDQSYAVGQILSLVYSYQAVGISNIFVDGISRVSQSNMGVGSIVGHFPSGFATSGLADISVGSWCMWANHTVSQADAAALAAGADPLSLGTPPDAYYTLAGTSGTAAHVGDAGLANSASGGSVYNIASVSANYSSDALIGGPLVTCPEAFVTRSGSLLACWIASTFNSFSIVNDNGVYDRSVLFVNVTDGGSDYTSPTATGSGGNPSVPAVYGPPVVVGGKIVGVPIWDAGDGYDATGASIAFSDSTGSGAVGVPVLGGEWLPVTASGGLPTVKVDGVAAPINTQKFLSTNASPNIFYQFQTPVNPGQVVTYTLPKSWASSSIGTSSASAADAIANNYAGVVHEPRFVLPPTLTMKMGFNHVPDPMTVGGFCLIGQDASKRFSAFTMTSWASKTIGIGSWIVGNNQNELAIPAGPTVVFLGGGSGAIAVCMIDGNGSVVSVSVASGGTGYPDSGSVAFPGGGGGAGATATYVASGGAIQSVTMVTHGFGYCDGIYTVQWDDTAPIGTGPYTPTTTITLNDGSTSPPGRLYVTPIASLSSPGTLVDGVLVGITIVYYVQYRPAAAYTYNAAVQMTFRGGSGTGPFLNTAIDVDGKATWRVSPPGNVINRANPVEPDGAITALCKTEAGENFVGTIRYMDCTLPSGGVSNARFPGDVTQLDDLSYNQATLFTFARVSAIRPYSHSISPNLYVDANTLGSVFTPGGSPTPYTIPINSDGFINVFGAANYLTMEFVTSSPHNMGSYQEWNTSITHPSYIQATNGQLGGIQNPSIATDLPPFGQAFYSTGTNTFITLYGSISPTGPTMPGIINNAAYTQGVTESIVNNSVGVLSIGSAGSSYAPGSTVPAIDPPASSWLTALATATTLAGAVNAIIPVAGHGGNNYAIAPLVTVQPPIAGCAAAIVTFTLVGGVISNLAITYSGFGYTGNVSLFAWGGGPGSGFSATAVVSNGVVVSLSGVAGGSGYTHPIRVVVPPPSKQATAHSTISGGSVNGLVLDTSGSGYLAVNIAGDGTGATGVAFTIPTDHPVPSAGGGVGISGLIVTNGGSGYTHATATITGGGGTGATVASVTIVAGVVTGLVLGASGGGYIPNYAGYPWVMVDEPAQQALIAPTITSGSISALTVVYGGRGHVVVPELVILGTGVGASATIVLSGDVVVGVTGLVGGSGYTGSHPVAVSVGPPARQAIGQLAVRGGRLQQGYIVDPGCGYTNTRPSASVVGVGTGGTLTTLMVFPFFINYSHNNDGCIPYEIAGGANAALPGSGCWFNIPGAATESLVTSVVTSVASHTPPGTPLWIEYVNEHWNSIFPYENYFNVVGGQVGSNADAIFASNTAWSHDVAEAYLTSIGRAGDLVRVYGSFVADPSVTARMVSYLNANSKRMDACAIAPYWYLTGDSSLQFAFASVISTNPHSKAFGTPWPWTRAMAHDLLRNLIVSDTRYVGSGLGGAPLGYFAGVNNALAKYNLAPGQTQRPQLVAYEAAIQQFVSDGIQASGPSLTPLLEVDLFHDPGMYDTMMAFFLMQQEGGQSVTNYFQIQFNLFGVDAWFLIRAEGQQPGLGDGSDGKAANLFWMNANTIPGAGSTAAAYTTDFSRFDVSPAMQAFRDWGSRTTSSPGLTVSPSSAMVQPGGTLALIPTLVNSSATLTASALHGTVSGSVTSGVAFTYTAPASGFSSDTVTVTDATDGLSAPCLITIQVAAPTLTVVPTSAVVSAGGTLSITATLTNSSATLSASALNGSVSTDAPTSGVPFTYTAPSVGFTSDAVTVTDEADGLAVTVPIAIPSPTPTPTSSGAVAILLIM